jgi:lactate dehydrogenase-like 2-hydroxyacid dehydrogenase
MTIRTSLLTGLAVAIVTLGTIGSAAAETLSTKNLPQARCSRPLDEEATRVNKLADLVAQYRVIMEKQPLEWVTFKYYEAELAASRRCLQSASAGQAVVR